MRGGRGAHGSTAGTIALGALVASALSAGWAVPARAADGEADQPEPWVRVTPRYPDEAQPYRVPADCHARFDLTSDGAPTHICVRCTSAAVPDAFEREAADALSAWRYPPEHAYGPKTRRGDLTVEIPFVLRSPPWSFTHDEAASAAASAPTCDPGDVS